MTAFRAALHLPAGTHALGATDVAEAREGRP